MKKIFSIVLLLLFLYNVVGYYGVYLGLSYQSDREIGEKLDANKYNQKESLTVKIPYTLPYQVDWTEFERADGQFEHNGEVYKVVKHKLERDTLFVVYVKDQQQTNLLKSLVDFVQTSTDSPGSQKATSLIKNILKDYVSTTSTMQASAAGWCKHTNFVTLEYPVILTDSQVFSPPPESIL